MNSHDTILNFVKGPSFFITKRVHSEGACVVLHLTKYKRNSYGSNRLRSPMPKGGEAEFDDITYFRNCKFQTKYI
jgi:hypothetical protein